MSALFQFHPVEIILSEVHFWADLPVTPVATERESIVPDFIRDTTAAAALPAASPVASLCVWEGRGMQFKI